MRSGAPVGTEQGRRRKGERGGIPSVTVPLMACVVTATMWVYISSLDQGRGWSRWGGRQTTRGLQRLQKGPRGDSTDETASLRPLPPSAAPLHRAPRCQQSHRDIFDNQASTNTWPRTSTRPMAFMRFLPSACLLRSFFLRLISPPLRGCFRVRGLGF